MQKLAYWIVLVFAILTTLSFAGAYAATGFLQNLALSFGSAFLSITLAISLVNLLLDQKSRKTAALPLARLVSLPIMAYHNDHVDWCRNAFGIDEFEKMLGKYEKNNKDPIAFSPMEREVISNLIDAKMENILQHYDFIYERLQGMIGVLGWSFDADIISAALHCQQNIAEFRENMNPDDEKQKLKRIEMFFDVDSSSGGVLMRLFEVLEKELPLADRRPN